MIKSGNSLAFEYNANGIRTKKTVNEIFHNYYLEGAKIHLETIKNDTNIKTLQYLYDDNDDVSGINYRGDTYYFVKNLQGDVIKLIDINGDCVVKYTYNAWGKICKITNGYNVTISDTDTTHIANINPFRYRGYYYDVETKLYYLQSRYYDPETCRFINADDANIILFNEQKAINLFAYCKNDCVNKVDHYGFIAIELTAATLSVALAALCAIAAIAAVLSPPMRRNLENLLQSLLAALASVWAMLVKAISDVVNKIKIKKRGKKRVWHHIVAKADLRAIISREVFLRPSKIDIDSPLNLAYVEEVFHQHLHTTAYHIGVTLFLIQMRVLIPLSLPIVIPTMICLIMLKIILEML